MNLSAVSGDVFRLRLRQYRKIMTTAISTRTTTAAAVPPTIAPMETLEDVEANAVGDEVEVDDELEVDAEVEVDDMEEAVGSVYAVYCT